MSTTTVPMNPSTGAPEVADAALQPGWRIPHEDFAWTPLVLPDPPEDARPGRCESPIRTFVVHFKSDTEIGRFANNDPLGFLRTHIPEMGIPEDLPGYPVRATLCRINAERPANPVHVRLLVTVDYGAGTIGLMHYKDEVDYSAVR